jgi:hypothetical protein
MDNMKNIKKNWLASLSVLDNNIVYSVIVVILVLYSSTIFDNINAFVGNLFNFSLLKLLGLVLIIYVAPKDTTVAILLAVSYVISVYYMVNNETFISNESYKNNSSEEEQKKTISQKQPNHVESYSSQREPNNFESYSNSVNHPNNKHDLQSNNKKELQSNNKHDLHSNSVNTNQKKNKNLEHFFPADNSSNGNAFDIRLKNTNVNTKQTDYTNKNQPVKMSQSCLSTYTPEYETLSDPCVPTATFQNEFNAQGLNFPEGFNSQVVGSPL